MKDVEDSPRVVPSTYISSLGMGQRPAHIQNFSESSRSQSLPSVCMWHCGLLVHFLVLTCRYWGSPQLAYHRCSPIIATISVPGEYLELFTRVHTKGLRSDVAPSKWSTAAFYKSPLERLQMSIQAFLYPSLPHPEYRHETSPSLAIRGMQGDHTDATGIVRPSCTEHFHYFASTHCVLRSGNRPHNSRWEILRELA